MAEEKFFWCDCRGGVDGSGEDFALPSFGAILWMLVGWEQNPPNAGERLVMMTVNEHPVSGCL